MDYIELSCKIESKTPDLLREMLTLELANMGYESFVETTDGMLAYVASHNFIEANIYSISFFKDLDLGNVVFKWQVIKDQNWNEEWEKNFNPVLIHNQCYIRATFHEPKPDVEYEIVIDPKMSFGTGHHETTSLMVEQMLTIDFFQKKVLDMGCGTGILAILASKIGAQIIDAIDIDEWSYQNSLENCHLNNISNVRVICGDRSVIPTIPYDLILANINRNILLKDMDAYAEHLISGGILLLSGIYTTDLSLLTEAAKAHNLSFILRTEKNKWASAIFQKK
jgi:ribosomal protein L11 methyltransferase